MTLVIIAVTLTTILASVFITLRYKGKEKESFIFKATASLGFVLIAIFSYSINKSNSLYFQWLLIALILGFLGDIFLGLKNLIKGKKIYCQSIGIILFLLGHIAYTVNYILQGGVTWWVFVINLFVAIILMSLTRKLEYKLSFSYKILGYIYSYTISLMVTSAISYFITFKTQTTAIMVLCGSISFYFSDWLLSASYFKSKVMNKKVLNLIVHISYYFAQILLALSVCFV